MRTNEHGGCPVCWHQKESFFKDGYRCPNCNRGYSEFFAKFEEAAKAVEYTPDTLPSKSEH